METQMTSTSSLASKASCQYPSQLDLFAAAVSNSTERIQELLTGRADPNRADSHGLTPLFKAASLGHTRAVETLLTDPRTHLEPHISYPGLSDGNTPLIEAAHLLISGASKEKKPETQKIIDLLLDRGADPSTENARGETLLSILCMSDDGIEIVPRLLKDPRVDPTHCAKIGRGAALHIAAAYNSHKTATLLLGDPKTKPNQLNKEGNTPLHVAIHAGFGTNTFDVIQALLAGGCDPSVLTLQGDSCLHLAAAKANVETVQIFLPDVDPDTRNKQGQTALHSAATSQQKDAGEIVTALYEKGFDPSAQCRSSRTPLHTAIVFSRHALIPLFCSLPNARFDLCDRDGSPPLHTALLLGLPLDKLAPLIQATDVTTVNIHGASPFLAAISSASYSRNPALPSIMQALLDRGFNPETPRSTDGKTPLHLATGPSKRGALNFLFNTVKAEPNPRDYMERTPFHDAAEDHLSKEWVVPFVETQGVELNPVDLSNKTPLDYAIEANFGDTVPEFLRQHGCLTYEELQSAQESKVP